eukprot:3409937-Pleurochrysis_carterae.AAC.2
MQIYCWSRNAIQRVEKVEANIKHGRRATANVKKFAASNSAPGRLRWQHDFFATSPHEPKTPGSPRSSRFCSVDAFPRDCGCATMRGYEEANFPSFIVPWDSKRPRILISTQHFDVTTKFFMLFTCCPAVMLTSVVTATTVNNRLRDQPVLSAKGVQTTIGQ